MLGTHPEIIGREAELADVGRFLDRAPADGARALLLEGELGIGKTTVWQASLDLARERGYRVLGCAPASEEARLSFVAIGDLLAPVLDELLPELPGPQRRALEIALLIRDLDGPPPDDRAVATAFRSALRTLDGREPVLLAVDDVQWLDAPSAATLAFAARRLEASDGVRLLLARRVDGERLAAPLGLDRVGTPGLERIELGPLSLGAVDHLVRTRLGVSLRRPTLVRVHDLSGGNPFFAAELARALATHDEPPPAGPLPVPGTLSGLVRDRIAALPKDTRAALLYVAAAGRPTLATLSAALGSDPREALGPALDAHIVELRGEAVSFEHPLLGAVVHGDAQDADRRRAHAALAGAVATVEERARHLALSASEPDEGIASELELAAYSAGARGGYSAVAELAERASELTPSAERAAGRRRATLAGEASWAAGDYEKGRAILQQVLDSAEPGPERADALLRLSRNPRDIMESIRLCTAALEEAESSPSLRGDIETFLAMLTYGAGDVNGAAELAARGAAAATEAGDVRREALALSLRAMMDGLAGRGFDLGLMRRMAAVEDETGHFPGRVGPRSFLASALCMLDEVDEARELGGAIVDEARDQGDISYARMLCVTSFLELRTGNLRLAHEGAREACEVWRQAGLPLEENEALGVLAQVEAELGLEEDARHHAELIAELGRGLQDLGEIRRGFILVSLELALERFAEASAAADAWIAAAERTGMLSSLLAPVGPWGVEAFAGAGEVERAERLAAEVEAEAARMPHPRLTLYALRSRGHVLAAGGDLENGVEHLLRAREVGVALGCPLEHGRTLLLLGQAQRRAQRRADARTTLGEALALFDHLGAPLWAERARRELGRIGGRPAARNELTSAEQRVAELVAEGMSNREAAAALFVTVKTVEAALSRVYRKLGIRSRAELARMFAGRPS
ncbi:MAG TPA: AAA family ATPase [Thermoleophilaceae bacterium]